jgi:broad specificity phosphatase PhoE
MRRILLLRHGETALNRSGALRGLLDVQLSSHGDEEARRLAARVTEEYEVAGIFSSPLRRARQTADPIARRVGIAVEIDERLRDIDYGPWAGRELETLSADERAEFHRWARDPEVNLSGAEPPATVQIRAVSALEEVARGNEATVAIVTHDAVLQLILCRLLSIDLRSYRGLTFHTASLTEIEHAGEGFRVRLLNSTWHLEVSPSP